MTSSTTLERVEGALSWLIRFRVFGAQRRRSEKTSYVWIVEMMRAALYVPAGLFYKLQLPLPGAVCD